MLFAMLLALLCIQGSTAAALNYSQHKPVLIGLDVDYPPLQCVDKQGNAQGVDIKMTNALMKRLNLPYTYNPQTWEQVKNLIMSDQIDLAMMVYSPYRKDSINYSKPVFRMYYQILYRQGHPVSLRNVRGLKVVGMASRHVSDTLMSGGATMSVNDDMLQSIRYLSQGKYDAMICFTYQTDYLIRTSGVTNVDYDDVGISPREYCYCSHDAALIQAINTQLDTMKADGTIDNIYGQAFLFGTGDFEIPEWAYYLSVSVGIVVIAMLVMLRHFHRKYRESDLILAESGMAIAEALCIYDANGDLVSLNEAACELMGITNYAAFLKTQPNVFRSPFFGAHIKPNSAEKVVRTIRILPDEHYKGMAFSHLITPHYVRFTFKGIQSGKSITYYVLTISDVTELMATQKRLEEENIRAERNERLKSIFLSNVSHALRTPLNSIVGFSDVILSTDNHDEVSCMEMLKIINENGHQLSHFVDELIQLSTIEGNDVKFFLTELSLLDVFNGIYTEIVSRIQPDVTLEIKHPSVLLKVHFDQMALEEMVKQLLSNAVKNTKKGTVTVSYDYRDKGLYVEVVDTGCGVNDQLKSSIFNLLHNKDTYVQSNTPGLGLSICNAMINACKGNIGMTSTVGQGSTFWFWIPCSCC